MAIINEGASFPSTTWAVVRFLLSVGGQYPAKSARALLCPPALLPEETRAKDETFSQAVRTLRELGLVTINDDDLSLTQAARGLSLTDLAGYTDLLRRAVLDPDRNAGLGDESNQTGPKDLVRALAWFLNCDAFTPLGVTEVTRQQEGAFASHLPNPIVNPVRWGRFVYWAPGLGFASQELFGDGNSGTRLVPDCTVAIQRTILSTWKKGERVDAADAIDRIIEELPVLPGGRYSRSLGLREPASSLASSLSFALLCGHDRGWIELGRRSDAAREVLVADPDTASGSRRVTEITIHGSLND